MRTRGEMLYNETSDEAPSDERLSFVFGGLQLMVREVHDTELKEAPVVAHRAVSLFEPHTGARRDSLSLDRDVDFFLGRGRRARGRWRLRRAPLFRNVPSVAGSGRWARPGSRASGSAHAAF